MTNKERRDIVNKAQEEGYQGSYVDLFRNPPMGSINSEPSQEVKVATTPDQQRQGLRPAHAQGRTETSMAFPDVAPGSNFNTIGMKKNIDFKEYSKSGDLIKSYENVPPGLSTSFTTGTEPSTVLETPSKLRYGGLKYGSVKRK
tara:strand:- start:1437 stop:1868 length:432 start_codon:yes stop_codon:yes gene_type:complete